VNRTSVARCAKSLHYTTTGLATPGLAVTAPLASTAALFVKIQESLMKITGATEAQTVATDRTRRTAKVAMQGKAMAVSSVVTMTVSLPATGVMARRTAVTDQTRGAVLGQAPKLCLEIYACFLSPTRISGSLAAPHLTLKTESLGAELKKEDWKTVRAQTH